MVYMKVKEMNEQESQVSLKKKKRLNELDGKTWEKYSISVWDMVKSKEETKLRHSAMFPVSKVNFSC